MTAPPAPIALDLLIVGGGIAGLWTLNRAVQQGYNAILIEKDALGGGQSTRSQGIIHGGTKYALKGGLTRAANAIAAMPDRWGLCLAGEGELDLTAARLLSDATYFWAAGSLRAKMTSFLASKALRSRVSALDPAARPPAFDDPAFKGRVYRVAEPVLDVPTVIAALAAPVAGRVFQLDGADLDYKLDADGTVTAVTLPRHGLTLQPKRIVLTAGEGFPGLAAPLHLTHPAMQRRPLHMVLVEHRTERRIFGHCIGTGTTPMLTITSHPAGDGRQVWYLGGALAESGVIRDPAAQIETAKATLAQALPWVTLEAARWATIRIDRAEPATATGARPDNAFAEAAGNVIAAWPTKLALAPDLADRVLALLPPPGPVTDLSALSALPPPPLARPFWEMP